jgi:Asp-tRNA(Asn)/Glu-tRNA(Gln) amidotransferase B subunit
MNDITKIIGTIIIWGAMVAMMSSVLLFSSGWVTVTITLVLAAAAAFSTGAVWMGSALIQHRSTTGYEREKSKNSSQHISRLIETMDEDQLSELSAALEDMSHQRR